MINVKTKPQLEQSGHTEPMPLQTGA